jgi:phosphoribosyl-ATP pyrophosphohydrolase
MSDTLDHLQALIAARRGADASTSYIAKLQTKGRAKMAQKLGEEAVETVIAAMQNDRAEMVKESADLLFHWLILLGDMGLTLEDIWAELARRQGKSGLDEKAARKN